MDERKPMAISTVGDTIVIINTICNMDISVFDEGRMELETTSSSLEWVERGGNIPQQQQPQNLGSIAWRTDPNRMLFAEQPYVLVGI